MRWMFLACALLLGLSVGFSVSCGCGDDDDDDDDASEDVWTDSTSGLTWQVSPTGLMDWEEAKAHCEKDGYGGYNDWRLPTVFELRTLIRGCDNMETGGECGVTDYCLIRDCLDESCYCGSGAGPNNGCYWPSELQGGCDSKKTSWFWSSSAVADDDRDAWLVGFGDGGVTYGHTYDQVYRARCVRGDDGDSGGGTWTDSSSGLTWQVNPPSHDMNWSMAKYYCEYLSMEGDDWRLPTISELRTLIRGCSPTETGGKCMATDDCLDIKCKSKSCGGCDSLAGPGSGGAYWPPEMSGEVDWYWSSLAATDSGTFDGFSGSAWVVEFEYGGQSPISDNMGEYGGQSPISDNMGDNMGDDNMNMGDSHLFLDGISLSLYEYGGQSPIS